MTSKWFRSTVLATAAVALSLTVAAAEVQPKAPESFRVTVTGQGRPMILIPGLTSSGAVWDGTVEHYKKQYQCHVLTLAGFAGVPAIGEPFLETVRKDVAAYIRQHKLEKPVIVGHSLGGFVALWLASAEPELTGKLVILDSLPFLGGLQPGNPTKEQRLQQMDLMRKMIASQSKEQYMAYLKQSKTLESMATKPEDVARIEQWAADSDVKAAANAMYDMYTIDLQEDIARIKVPVLVLGTWEGMKQHTTREAVDKIFRTQFSRLKGLDFRLLDNTRHFIMYDDPKTMFTLVDAFLK